MKKCFAEVRESGEKFTFLVDDDSPIPEVGPTNRGKLSEFQPPEMGRLYGEAYVAYVNFRNKTEAALGGYECTMQVPSTVLVTSWEEV